jgi:hypothetical protein
MTAGHPVPPRSALELLAGPGEGPAQAMARVILPAAGQVLNSALGKLPAALRDAAARDVAAAAVKLLDDVNLAEVLVDGWRKQHELAAAARRTLAHPGSTELVKLATHCITLTQRPYVSVLVNDHPWATVNLTLSLVFDVTALQAKISSGELAALQSGRCDITAALAIQDADPITKQAHLELPGFISLRQGIRLLPAKDYPGGGGQTKTNGADQGSRPGQAGAQTSQLPQAPVRPGNDPAQQALPPEEPPGQARQAHPG